MIVSQKSDCDVDVVSKLVVIQNRKTLELNVTFTKERRRNLPFLMRSDER